MVVFFHSNIAVVCSREKKVSMTQALNSSVYNVTLTLKTVVGLILTLLSTEIVNDTKAQNCNEVVPAVC